MEKVHVNPDLAKERLRATFDPEQLTYFLYNGVNNTKRKRYLREFNVPYRVFNLHMQFILCGQSSL